MSQSVNPIDVERGSVKGTFALTGQNNEIGLSPGCKRVDSRENWTWLSSSSSPVSSEIRSMFTSCVSSNQ